MFLKSKTFLQGIKRKQILPQVTQCLCFPVREAVLMARLPRPGQRQGCWRSLPCAGMLVAPPRSRRCHPFESSWYVCSLYGISRGKNHFVKEEEGEFFPRKSGLCLFISLYSYPEWRDCALLGVVWDFLKDTLPSSFRSATPFYATKLSAERVQRCSRGARAVVL